MTVSQAAIRLAFMMRRTKNLWPFGATDEKRRKKKKYSLRVGLVTSRMLNHAW